MKKSPFVDDNERKRALGTLDDLSPLTRAFLSETIKLVDREEDESEVAASKAPPWFVPLERPRAGDWLSCQKETPQGFDSFCRKSVVSQPHGRYKKLLLVPIGTFPPAVLDVKAVARIAAAFFDCPVSLAKPVSIKQLIANPTKTGSRASGEPFHREGNEGQDQLHASMLLDELTRVKSTNRTYASECWAVVGLTLVDLFPRAEWNFVYGLGRASDGASIFSFARYIDRPAWPTLADACNPAHEHEACEIQAGELSDSSALLADEEVQAAAAHVMAGAVPAAPDSVCRGEFKGFMRACARVLCHETCHLLGMGHCVHYQCLMNGSNHEEEANRRALRLCPVCLRKLAHALANGSVGTGQTRPRNQTVSKAAPLPGGGGGGRVTRSATAGPRPDASVTLLRRYVRLHELYKGVGMEEEAEWIAARLAAARAAAAPTS